MRTSDIFAIVSHIVNFIILGYFISFLINLESIATFDIVISFIGLFASLIANIMSVLEKNKDS